MPKQKYQRITVIVAITLLLAASYLFRDRVQSFFKSGVKTPVTENARVVSVNTLVAQQTPSYQQTRSITGIVRARRSGDLSFARSGQLERLLVQQGEKVVEGDLLAELNTDQLKNQKLALESERARATAKLNKLLADSQFRSMESIRVEVAALKKQLQELRDENERDSPPPDATDTRTNGAQRLDDTQRRLDLVDATSADPQVAEQQAVVGKLTEQIAGVDAEIELNALRAPYDGVIAQRYVGDGVLVSPTVPIIKIVERDALEVWVGLPADDVDELTLGESQTVFVGEHEVTATVFAIAPELDQTTRTRTAVLSLDQAADQSTDQIVPGQIARIEITHRINQIGFWLPIQSLTREARGLWSVYQVVDAESGDQIVSRNYVEVVHLQGENARVRGTLLDGAILIADGTHRVVPGQKVRSAKAPHSLVAQRGGQEPTGTEKIDPGPLP